MAGITDQQSDPANHRVFSMWEEAGIQFRSNLVTEVGGTIPLHAHSYDHVALCTAGKFRCDVDDDSFEVVPGSQIFIAQMKQHMFTLLEMDNRPGEILCLWPTPKD